MPFGVTLPTGSPLTVYVDGQYKQFTGITAELGDALTRGQALRPDGSYFTVTTFLGGFLLDGCPLNIIFNQGWLAGQIDALKAGGILPTCLVPGTADYVAFYGTTGVEPPKTTTPFTLPPPTGTNVIPPPAPGGGVPPVIQVTETPYTPPIDTQTVAEQPATNWTPLIIAAIVLYFLMKR